MPAATRVLPTSDLSRLLGELRELPGWPDVDVNACLLLAEVLECLAWARPLIGAVLGLDAFAVERGTAEVVA
jgi:hypothetical protein